MRSPDVERCFFPGAVGPNGCRWEKEGVEARRQRKNRRTTLLYEKGPIAGWGLDLRTEPIVLTIPPIEKKRYFSIQLIDPYLHDFDYIGSRTTGNDGGNFIIAGPKWKGKAPDGITKVIRCETELMLAVYRTQLFNTGDIENVKAIQAGYKVQPLSAFLGKPGAPCGARHRLHRAADARRDQEIAEGLSAVEFCVAVLSHAPIRAGTHDPFCQTRNRCRKNL